MCYLIIHHCMKHSCPYSAKSRQVLRKVKLYDVGFVLKYMYEALLLHF